MFEEVDTKVWWASKTIWVQIVSLVFIVGSKFDWWPTEISQEETVTSILMVVNLLTIGTRTVGRGAKITLKNKNAT